MIIERINLVPQKPFSERIRHIIPIILLVLVGVITAVIYLQNNFIATKIAGIDIKISRLNDASDKATILIARRKRLSIEVKRLQNEDNELFEKTTKLARLNAKKISLSQALIRIAAAIGPSVKCNTINFRGAGGQIQGTALKYNDAPQIVKKLNRDPLFENVILQNIDQIKDAKRQELNFNIHFTLKTS